MSKTYPLSRLVFVGLVLLAGCAVIPTAPPLEPLKTFTTAEGYYQEGKMHFDRGNYQEAERYLGETIRLDPNNQKAHAMAGVAYARLGRCTEAKIEFETTVRLNQNSSEGKQAQEWLRRLGEPLRVLVLPVSSSSSDRLNELITKRCSELLYKYLLASGLYQISGAERDYEFSQVSRIGVNPQSISQLCDLARKKGIKIIIAGNLDDVKARVFDPGVYMQVGGKTVDFKSYDASFKISLWAYATRDCRLIHQLTEEQSFKNVISEKIDAAVEKTLDFTVQKLLKELNAQIILDYAARIAVNQANYVI